MAGLILCLEQPILGFHLFLPFSTSFFMAPSCHPYLRSSCFLLSQPRFSWFSTHPPILSFFIASFYRSIFSTSILLFHVDGDNVLCPISDPIWVTNVAVRPKECHEKVPCQKVPWKRCHENAMKRCHEKCHKNAMIRCHAMPWKECPMSNPYVQVKAIFSIRW